MIGETMVMIQGPLERDHLVQTSILTVLPNQGILND
jgi:hypothetical protein